MTGLDTRKDQIMEFACILTDGQLDNATDGPEMIIHVEDQYLNNMDEWCTK